MNARTVHLVQPSRPALKIYEGTLLGGIVHANTVCRGQKVAPHYAAFPQVPSLNELSEVLSRIVAMEKASFFSDGVLELFRVDVEGHEWRVLLYRGTIVAPVALFTALSSLGHDPVLLHVEGCWHPPAPFHGRERVFFLR